GGTTHVTRARVPLDIGNTAPLPDVVVHEAVARQILTGQHTRRRGECHRATLECLNRARREVGNERRIVESLGRKAPRRLDVEQVAARGRRGETQYEQRRRDSPVMKLESHLCVSVDQKVSRRVAMKLAVGGRIVWKPLDSWPFARISGSHTC